MTLKDRDSYINASRLSVITIVFIDFFSVNGFTKRFRHDIMHIYMSGDTCRICIFCLKPRVHISQIAIIVEYFLRR